MCHSESVGKIAAALAKAQQEIGGASMDQKNPFFKSSYSSLKSVISVAKGPLNNNGIAIVQGCDGRDEKGNLLCFTMLVHESGEWLKSTIAVKPVKDDPQQIGSGLSYARRYGLSAMALIFQEDDDGNAASGKTAQTRGKTAQKKSPPKKQEAPAENTALEAAVSLMRDTAKKNGVQTREEGFKLISAFLKKDVTDFNQLTIEDAEYCTKAFAGDVA